MNWLWCIGYLRLLLQKLLSSSLKIDRLTAALVLQISKLIDELLVLITDLPEVVQAFLKVLEGFFDSLSALLSLEFFLAVFLSA